MPIRIVAEQGQYIPSSAARMLAQELRRYRDQKIRGRSFLIAGHRGSGKTSLVTNALHELKDEALQPLARQPRRFLPIHIHGPSMFTFDAPVTPAAVVVAASEANPKASSVEAKPPSSGAAPALQAEPASSP